MIRLRSRRPGNWPRRCKDSLRKPNLMCQILMFPRIGPAWRITQGRRRQPSAGCGGKLPAVRTKKPRSSGNSSYWAVKTAWESLRQRWADVGAQCRALDKEHKGQAAVDAKIAEASEKLEAEQEHLRRTS